MAGAPLPAGPGGTLFAGGGGAGGSATGDPFGAPGGTKMPSLGKNSVQQNLSSPHSGLRSTITSGDPMSRMMGQYGKGHSFASLLGGTPGKSAAGGKSGEGMIRGGAGQMRRISGGLGPGKAGQPGQDTDYSMTSPDQE
jgi:hypothetical protein